MNFLRILAPAMRTISLKSTPYIAAPPCINICQNRGITALCSRIIPASSSARDVYSGALLSPLSQSLNVKQPSRTYKVRTVLKKRCAGCYFERREGRLFVECTLKPRHKQMQQKKGMALFRDDLSTGNWRKSIYWGWQKDAQFYKQGNTEFARYKWLEGRIGTEI